MDPCPLCRTNSVKDMPLGRAAMRFAGWVISGDIIERPKKFLGAWLSGTADGGYMFLYCHNCQKELLLCDQCGVYWYHGPTPAVGELVICPNKHRLV